MMYVGLSLGRCLHSILDGEVSESDVLVIVTGTDAPTFESFIAVVTNYFNEGNPYSRSFQDYKLEGHSFDEVFKLATLLWESGKIHQPRTFTAHKLPSNRDNCWLHVVPTNTNTTVAVVDAYNHYKLLSALTT